MSARVTRMFALLFLIEVLVWAGLLPGVGAQDAKLSFSIVRREIVEERLASPPHKNRKRGERLTSLFEEVGCADLAQQDVRGSKMDNVVCTLPGETSRVILAGAHYDHTGDGQGIVDNWSGASLLASLYQSLSTKPRAHTFIFVGFADEERGLRGSRHYVKTLSPEARDHLKAVVNLDCLGLDLPKVWVSRSDDRLVQWFVGMASEMSVHIEGVDIEQVGSTDSESFRRKKIPVITIHSATQRTLSVIHSRDDQLQAIDKDAYFETYKLLAAYLTLLDSVWPPS